MSGSWVNQNSNGLLSNLIFDYDHSCLIGWLIGFLLVLQCYIDMRRFSSHVFHYSHSLYIVNTPWISSVLHTKYKPMISATSPTLEQSIGISS